jgi:GDP-4-dehydro-6-deoxy-D-mannose reductase
LRVLITGVTGFLGRNLAAYLSGRVPNIFVRGISRSDCDLADGIEQFINILQDFKPDVIFHLAGRIAGSDREFTKDNEEATSQFFTAARRCGSNALIVLGSTISVYGTGGYPQCPVDESFPPAPRGAYAQSKYSAERHAACHIEQGGRVIIARMTNPVGFGMHPDLLCGKLARQIVAIENGNQQPILELGDLAANRDFIHCEDCVRALWHLVLQGKVGDRYNVASGTSVKISDVVKLFLELTDAGPIEVRSTSRSMVRSTITDQWVSNKHLRQLGWEPRYDLRQTIAELLSESRRFAAMHPY